MNKAIEVFDDLTEKTAESYNWIIRGLAQVSSASFLQFPWQFLFASYVKKIFV